LRPEDILIRDGIRTYKSVDLTWLNGATVLVTGASGLVGIQFLAAFAAARQAGVALNAIGQTRTVAPDYLRSIAAESGFRLIQSDLGSPFDWASLPATDVIIHAAGYAQPTKFMADEGATLLVNVGATVSLLRRMPIGGRFLFVSSSELYSGLEAERYTESDIGRTTPDHPRAAYIEGKRAGEAACHAFHRNGSAVSIARLALAYGPGARVDDQRVLASFIHQALTTGRIAMLDPGAAMRTYCYVTDAIRMMLMISHQGTQGVYNVGGDSRLTIHELAELVAEHAGATLDAPIAVSYTHLTLPTICSV